jgi:hypothetical protein
MAAADTYATVEELLEAVFSMQSIPRLYNEGQLPLEENFLVYSVKGRIFNNML